jgi:prepilin-type N-terminal cleavage/methylation domain-containing protein
MHPGIVGDFGKRSTSNLIKPNHTMILTRRYTKPVDAFTLIEMMTVVAIMVVHTMVAIPGIKMAMVNAQMERST